ncbi:hypothetical protein [Caulobacter sp. FWC2]|uniref:hypothetical protein n=1 Tax=Caulobacter sp. FWC2 TaxID=69664 RepID=UPI0018ED16FB|nr:hypothetical protein [Caulobacter sp. FWC2]
MDRDLHVEVDGGSWPNPGPPHFPATFTAGASVESVNLPSILLTIGLLTTPSHATGVSLSEFWAWVRYLHAIADTQDMRLTRSFWDLDAHQKTILSDDFGMGVPVNWLMGRLPIETVCDGRYFIERVAATTGAVAVKTAKRGPNKSPDFVFQDTAGTWHVMECKGTQSGLAYRDRQLGETGPPPTGARAQKRTIIFPPGHTGQRLACGLAIGVEDGAETSLLKIVDPPAEEEDFEVTANQLEYADDAVFRSTASRALRLAGFGATSSSMSAPSGSSPSSRPTKGKSERRRVELIAEKERLAQAELAARASRRRFQADGEQYYGREIHLDLPAPLIVDDRVVRSVRIRQGVQARVLAEMRRRATIEEPLGQADAPWRQTFGKATFEHHPSSARLSLGSFFVSELHLQK